MQKAIIGALLGACSLAGQVYRSGPVIQTSTYAALPATGVLGKLYGVTDCLTAACAAGGGSIKALLVWNGSAYVLYASAAFGGYTTTGSGTVLALATSPVFTTPTLGVASATTVNKVTLTAPVTGSTLTIADGKTATINNTLTFNGTDTSSVAFGTGGTVTYTANNLSVFAATTSSQLAGVLSDETGSGAAVFGTAPTLGAPILSTYLVDTVGSNVASASTIALTSRIHHITGTTTINTITAPASYAQSGKGGCVVLIPDGLWATGTSGNIALATTAVVSKAVHLCYDNATSKWYPSY